MPIIPGIKPLTHAKQLIGLPKIFNIDLPLALSEAVEKCDSPDKVKEVGIEWTIQQCKELVKFGAPVLHYYTMGNPEPTKRIAEAVF